ncbi:hypothetical protein [Paracoccus benzoatiresistens]|uniref:Uncharacterized protein n=1 Tax=Paracoccus benzoatiresistens TaxID=2997341 RepID=A0ABT4JCV3_9RHOB|nr:hypothetical protein [Paracoccus sp. EF6]MCZ0964178.1 hypothetical protein [Paracoccus sp. EF6]
MILTTPEEIETWMSAEWAEAARLQRPLDDLLFEVLEPEEEDRQGRLF